MRGAPQVGFSATIRKIKARTSLLICFRPPICLTLEIHVQYRRNPARCQFTTVLGVTKTRGFLHPDQNRSQRNPEQLVHGSQSTARSLGVQSEQLLMKSQVFKDEVLTGTETADQPAEEMSERRDHSRNHIGKVRIELCAKSFILQVYDVSARYQF